MEEGLFEKAFRERNEKLGLTPKLVNNQMSQSKLSRPMIAKTVKQTQPQIIINVNPNGGQYRQPMPYSYAQAPRKRPRRTRTKAPKSKPLLTKAEKERLRKQTEYAIKSAKKAGKATGKAVKSFVGFLKSKRTKNKSIYK